MSWPKHIGDFLGRFNWPRATPTTPTTGPKPNKNRRLGSVSSSPPLNRHGPDSVPLTPDNHLLPFQAQFYSTKKKIESFLKSSETSEFGSFRLMTYPGDLQITVRVAFLLMTTDKELEALVTGLSMDAAVRDAMMSNKVIQNYRQTGAISEDDLAAQEEMCEGASWDPKKSTSIIGAIMDEVVTDSGVCSVELKDESKRAKLQLAFLMSTVIFVVGLEHGRDIMKKGEKC